MAFTTEPIIVAKEVKEKIFDPRDKKKIKKDDSYYQWWLAEDEKELQAKLLSTTAFLTNYHSARIRQASLYSRLFSGKPLYNYLASTSTLDNSQQMPMGRPTANVVYSCIDTITSRFTQDEPTPIFLTDAGSYKERKVSKEMNKFIEGEFYRCEAHAIGAEVFRDCAQLGDGFVKVLRDDDNKVKLERTLSTELMVDFNDAYYGKPRGLIQKKLCDRGVFAQMFPKEAEKIYGAQGGNVDNSPQSTDTCTDEFIISEGWHLPSGKKAKDGRHVIVCTEGTILDEPWTKTYFPFEQIGYNKNTVGFFSQGLAEILFPLQMEIYKRLIFQSQCVEMSAPKWIISELSKVLETSFNNNIQSIIKVKTMAEAPQILSHPPDGSDNADYIKWLIETSYAMAGISALNASAQKPAGLNSGEAQRVFEDTQSMRFAALQKRYQNFYNGLAYKMIDMAVSIANETGSYSTVYPGKDGTREIDLPIDGECIKDTYVIKCFNQSALPKDPAGRQAKLSEMLAAGEISNQEFRRMSNFPDLEQSDQLAVALEERVLHDLDQIIEKGEKGYNPPDPFILDPTNLAETLTVQTINKYAVSDLEEEKMDLLRNYWTAIQLLKSQAMPPPAPVMAPNAQAGGPGVVPPAASVSPTSNVQV